MFLKQLNLHSKAYIIDICFKGTLLDLSIYLKGESTLKEFLHMSVSVSQLLNLHSKAYIINICFKGTLLDFSIYLKGESTQKLFLRMSVNVCQAIKLS